MKAPTRRNLPAALAAAGLAAAASAQAPPQKQVHYRNGQKPDATPLYNSAISFGDLVFLSGTGVTSPPDVAGQTRRVLESLERRLLLTGSSMQQVLKCTVFLADLADYGAMNDAFRGAFGPNPPVRTTVAVSGIPAKNCRVEIEIIAYRESPNA
ncbi:MAG: RidA family protein [Acidobacteria bacterium]|nr:RidA family protein [Acidobacteriota bacterium]